MEKEAILEKSGSAVLYFCLICVFSGFFASGILSAGHFLDLPVPCGGSNGCMTVAGHPSSRIFGIPIAYLGLVVYSFLTILLSFKKSRYSLLLLTIISGVGTLISGWLLFYSISTIKATCVWCAVSGFSMLLIFLSGLVLIQSRDQSTMRPIFVFILFVITSSAIGVQGHSMKMESEKPPVSSNALQNIQANELVDPLKSVGKPDAPVTILIFEDLWCPACRLAHRQLYDFFMQHPEKIQIAVRHLPLWEMEGHETSRAAAAMAEIAAERGLFWTFVDSLHHHKQQLNAEGYLGLMRNMGFDPEIVESRLNTHDDPAIAKVIRDEDLAFGLGIEKTPSFIVFGKGLSPVSATMKTLPEILNSPAVLAAIN